MTVFPTCALTVFLEIKKDPGFGTAVQKGKRAVELVRQKVISRTPGIIIIDDDTPAKSGISRYFTPNISLI